MAKSLTKLVESDLIKCYKLTILLFTLLFLTINTVYGYDGAYGVTTTPEYVHVDGAKCSCIHSDGYYYHTNITFLNYCPYCHHYGTLYYEQQSYWVEGIWVCGGPRGCDMDFCCVHGRSHDNYGYYLIPYQIPEPKPVETKKSEPTKLEVVKEVIKTHKEIL